MSPLTPEISENEQNEKNIPPTRHTTMIADALRARNPLGICVHHDWRLSPFISHCRYARIPEMSILIKEQAISCTNFVIINIKYIR